MRTHLLPILCFGMLLFGAGCSGPTTERHMATRAADIAAIKAMSDARAEAFRKGKAEDIAIHFTEDGVLMAPGAKATKGRAAVRAYYQKIFDEYDADLVSGYETVDVDANLAYGQGFAKVTLRPRAGGPRTESTAKYINILKRQPDGTWKTTHDIWNANE